jgi:hypothetical protein
VLWLSYRSCSGFHHAFHCVSGRRSRVLHWQEQACRHDVNASAANVRLASLVEALLIKVESLCLQACPEVVSGPLCSMADGKSGLKIWGVWMTKHHNTLNL